MGSVQITFPDTQSNQDYNSQDSNQSRPNFLRHKVIKTILSETKKPSQNNQDHISWDTKQSGPYLMRHKAIRTISHETQSNQDHIFWDTAIKTIFPWHKAIKTIHPKTQSNQNHIIWDTKQSEPYLMKHEAIKTIIKHLQLTSLHVKLLPLCFCSVTASNHQEHVSSLPTKDNDYFAEDNYCPPVKKCMHMRNFRSDKVESSLL